MRGICSVLPRKSEQFVECSRVDVLPITALLLRFSREKHWLLPHQKTIRGKDHMFAVNVCLPILVRIVDVKRMGLANFTAHIRVTVAEPPTEQAVISTRASRARRNQRSVSLLS